MQFAFRQFFQDSLLTIYLSKTGKTGLYTELHDLVFVSKKLRYEKESSYFFFRIIFGC